MFPSSIQSHAAIPESVISPHEMARLECPTLSSVEQPGEFGQGGKPAAVLPQGGQGKCHYWPHLGSGCSTAVEYTPAEQNS